MEANAPEGPCINQGFEDQAVSLKWQKRCPVGIHPGENRMLENGKLSQTIL